MDGLALMVLLRHDLPDGSGHYDWLLERPGAEGLVTFRVAERIDRPDCTSFEAVRIADHRREYLTYEGPVSGGRGTVTRVAWGPCRISEGPGMVQVQADLAGCERRYEGRLMEGDRWSFRAF